MVDTALDEHVKIQKSSGLVVVAARMHFPSHLEDLPTWNAVLFDQRLQVLNRPFLSLTGGFLFKRAHTANT